MDGKTTSREEANVLKNAINGLVNDFGRMGFDRDQIGAALAGIGLALVQVHCSPRSALAMVDRLRDMLMADASPRQ
jgi:hypothetical protein